MWMGIDSKRTPSHLLLKLSTHSQIEMLSKEVTVVVAQCGGFIHFAEIKFYKELFVNKLLEITNHLILSSFVLVET